MGDAGGSDMKGVGSDMKGNVSFHNTDCTPSRRSGGTLGFKRSDLGVSMAIGEWEEKWWLWRRS